MLVYEEQSSAELLSKLTKAIARIYIWGRIGTKVYKDHKGGTKRSARQINVHFLLFKLWPNVVSL